MKCIFIIFLSSVLLTATNNSENVEHTYREKNIANITGVDFQKNITFPHLLKVVRNNSESRFVLEESDVSDEHRGRLCLKNVTECMDKDITYHETTNRLGELLFKSLPPFDLSKVRGISKECKRQSKKYIEDLKRFRIWALKMYDSSAKLSSGILNGNINQFGDFDMCLSSHSGNIDGQYCLAYMEIQTPQSSYLSGLHQLIQSHHHFRSKLEDPGHRVPRFSTIHWALCVPSACSPGDIELGLKATVETIFDETDIELRYKIDPDMCVTKAQKEIPTSTYIILGLFSAFIAWEFVATFYDYWAVAEKNKWIMAFSLRKNCEYLLTPKSSAGDIQAVHGVRCMNAVLLLLSHKSMALFFQPYSNRTDFVEFIGRPFSVIARAASLYTDPFIMLSGALTAYSLIGKLNRTQRINIVEEYISRLFRIVPAFAALIAFCTFILPWINNGPLWNLVVSHHSEICKQNWWRNMLFIHNYFGFKDMCLTHTHHVGIDTQLFFISPLLIYVLWKWPKRGSIVLIFLATISTVMRYYVTYTMRLSNYVHFGTSVQQLFDTADNMYILPAHRATVYIMGIFMGYLLKNSKNIQLTKVQLNIGHTFAIFSFLWSYFGAAYMGSMDYVYNPSDAAWYAAVSPILWCHAFAWVIITSQLGYEGLLGKLFSARVFTLWTNISYTVYLVQFPVYFYNVGTTRSSTSYGFFSLLFNLQEYIWIIGLSVLLTVTFELPFQNLRNILFKKKHSDELLTAKRKIS